MTTKARKSAKRQSRQPATKYLIAAEREALKRYGVTVSNVGVQFSQDLDEAALRHVWQLVSAIARRRPKAEGSPGFLIGDWANETQKRLGKKASYRIIEQEQEAYGFSQHLLRFAGATLLSLQQAEFAVGIACRLLDPKGGAVTTQEMFSPDSVSRKRTLGQLNQEMRQHQIFVPAFEQRMNAFVKRRNRFAHQLLVEHMPLAQSEHTVRMKGFRDLESSIGTLFLEANEVTAIFFGLFTAIGVSAAERENVKNLEALLDNRGFLDWREQLRKFAAVRRQP